MMVADETLDGCGLVRDRADEGLLDLVAREGQTGVPVGVRNERRGVTLVEIGCSGERVVVKTGGVDGRGEPRPGEEMDLVSVAS
ncbi:hypothetical protein [Rhodococcus sp. PBTS 1]|uniref:hypothetical protein n=1 Tax=Rhodococcus sp. PBTS 1 TaxID=1653478 RepID=UPI0012FF6965|nr:hypothetical protein [Rhodococcus sp. PBTS 1]MBY6314956.1 hypothetical protein [Rhodococcus kroppenstedtii]